jgi:NAD(P)-dependent dehydrogenase (short-subunit alcohol dehydrogenase family)
VREFSGRVAVVTGAASGIGLALARCFGAQGMKLVLADIEEAALHEADAALRADGVSTLAVRTDVTRATDVATLAERTLDHFGAVHLVCNNAGVFTGGLCWEAPLEDYEWLIGVNVWGVIHGIRTFVPILLRQGGEGHVVNTASMAGLISVPFAGIYTMTKHAVLSLSETLYHELALRDSAVGVSALCPEIVSTRIDRSERNRPEHLRPRETPDSAERSMVLGSIETALPGGTPPATIAERVLDAVRERRFYVLSEDHWRRSSEARLEDLRSARNPTLAPPASPAGGGR